MDNPNNGPAPECALNDCLLCDEEKSESSSDSSQVAYDDVQVCYRPLHDRATRTLSNDTSTF